MGKSKKAKARPITVAEAEAQLARARRREAAAAAAAPPRVNLATLDTPDVTHAEQYAEFLNRPGRFYLAHIIIPLDKFGLDEKLGVGATFKADDQQLIYLVEVLRQIRGAIGEGCRIDLTPAEPNAEEHRVAGPLPRKPTTEEHRAAHREVVRRHKAEMAADRVARGDARLAEARRQAEKLATHKREWCCNTPISGPHRPGCQFEPRADEPVDYTGPVEVAEPAGPWAGVQPPDRELTRDELAAMLPGQTRAEAAAELGKAPEDIGGTVRHADVLPEDLAAELGVPVESLRRIAIAGGGYAYTVTPQPAEPAGRHAAAPETE
ncbi:hypothetical protein [Mycobacterium phage Weirdo19]|uniref:Uncharacterized protein n=1 Tax=Mycobacterium phage Weirdo19 TaxID=2601610 RepID=A0A6M2YSZ3_9CAUD|nr:hypothetical protein KDJ11_gp73 [Mycobacterium phage Weirdo19]QEA10841.1 hypothetical protein [Mycobacterium phage Weirdo19]